MKKILNKIIITLLIIMMIILNNLTIVNTVNAANNKKNYYYEQLDNNAKIIYDALNRNVEILKKYNFLIDFSDQFNDLLHKENGKQKLGRAFQDSIDAFYFDHPELFYLDFSKLVLYMYYTNIGNNVIYTVKMRPLDNKNILNDFFKTEYEVNRAISKVEKIRNDIIKPLSNESDYRKILRAHGILVDSIKYDTTLNRKNTRNIYGALIENEVVCEGYAKAFKYIMDSLGVECILVSGTATTSSATELHMWNYVKMNGIWYGVDVTWDDPIVNGNIQVPTRVRYNYFLKGKNIFGQSHNPSGIISYNGTKYLVPTLANINYIVPSSELPFEDILNNSWYYSAVKYNYENNMIRGLNDYTFGPSKNLTRGMLVTILHRIEGSPSVSEASKFSDVQNTNDYYYTAVKWATQNNIISGYNSGKFGPNDSITREQLAVILSKYSKFKGKYRETTINLTGFKDASKISSFAKTGMQWAVGNGVITGNATSKTLNPLGTTTRAEAASMLYKYCKNIGK